MSEDMNKKFSDFIDRAMQKAGETSKDILAKLDVEKNKAEIKAEIGYNERDLRKAYEKVGRDFFAAKEAGKEYNTDNSTFDLIRSKEKVIELLNEKLKTFGE